MEFKIPAPIQINGKPYSQSEMVVFIVRHDRRFQREAAKARLGQAILDAFETARGGVVMLDAEAGELLKEAVERPTCGWIFRGRKTVVDGKPQLQRFHVPTIEFLPLIDPIANAT